MLKTILNRLNGHATEPTSLRDELTGLERDRDATKAEIARLAEDRRQALLDDASDKDLDKIERAAERASVKLEKIQLAEADIRGRYQKANAEQRAKDRAAAEAKFLAEFRDVFDGYITGLRAMAELQRRANEIRRAASGTLGEAWTGVHLPVFVYGGILSEEHISAWIARNERMVARAAGIHTDPPGKPPRGGIRFYQGQPNSEHYDPTRPPGPQRPSLQHAVAIDTWSGHEIGTTVGARGPRLPDDDQPLGDGEVRAIVLRSGYCAPDGQSQVGRRVRLKRDIAIKAAQGGAITIVDDPQREEAERLSERTFRPVGSVSEAHGDPTIVGRQ